MENAAKSSDFDKKKKLIFGQFLKKKKTIEISSREEVSFSDTF